MTETAIYNIPSEQLLKVGISTKLHYQLNAEELTTQTISRNEGVLNDTGALCIRTGKFTGRSPKDKYTVMDELTENTVHWNQYNIPVTETVFNNLKEKMVEYLNSRKELWVRDCFACADTTFQIAIRVINENPWSNLFAHNMFIRPHEDALAEFVPEWQILHAPGFYANPETDGTRQENFAMISFSQKTIIIGGTGYTGEMKKGIFTVLNYILPQEKKVLSMHCSANAGSGSDVAVFFGLSGTGKTTLSADTERQLIGDDEHGWTDTGIFNFEGGCYAKCIDLTEEKEPEIFHAIRPGALVENIGFIPGSDQIDFTDKTITENTRVSYPLHFISNAKEPAVAGLPQNIFFLTCDAYGILPPVSRLTPAQAMYQFISGYTARVAGTEAGVTEPKATFSACFGAPFLPLHPGLYAAMLGEKLRKHNVNVWLINTGWIGGPHGTGSRIALKYTRAMIKAALSGKLNQVAYDKHPVFGMMIPNQCPGVPDVLLNPRNTWSSGSDYDAGAMRLARMFKDNFEQYKEGVSAEILAAAPNV